MKSKSAIMAWLLTMRGVMRIVPISTARELFVVSLHDGGCMYHFDDDAHEIINGMTGKALFTPDEADVVNEIRDYLYGNGELFDIALELES